MVLLSFECASCDRSRVWTAQEYFGGGNGNEPHLGISTWG